MSLAARVQHRPPLLRIRSKMDLAAAQELSADEIGVSAVTGANLDQLTQKIATMLVPKAPAAGSAVPFTSEQVSALSFAQEKLATGNLDESVRFLCTAIQGAKDDNGGEHDDDELLHR
jgi:tRNA U34 5-carboxymethylaminomethyl modifying GTPase MnmE/TrmE